MFTFSISTGVSHFIIELCFNESRNKELKIHTVHVGYFDYQPIHSEIEPKGV